jgi:hypothetical protein
MHRNIEHDECDLSASIGSLNIHVWGQCPAIKRCDTAKATTLIYSYGSSKDLPRIFQGSGD